MELHDTLQLSRREYEEMESEKDRIIADRDMEIEQLQKKMEDMSSEFAEMLKVRTNEHAHGERAMRLQHHVPSAASL